MISIDIFSRVPIYQQIIDGIKKDILLGLMPEGVQIPSIRELSVEVGINPNTVSKAYLELERMGILTGAAGKGYFVSPGAVAKLREKTVAEEKSAFLAAAKKLAQNGISEPELQAWLRQIFTHEIKEENQT